MEEQWADIPGYPGYSISSAGRVFSYRNCRGGMSDVGHFLKPLNQTKYYSVSLWSKDGIPRSFLIHRLVAMAFIPCSDPSLVVDHIDGVKTNNDVSNLEWVTCKENSMRAVRMGLFEPTYERTRTPLIVTDLWTGEEMFFEGIREAASVLGYYTTSISRAVYRENNKIGHYIIELAGREETLLFSKRHERHDFDNW